MVKNILKIFLFGALLLGTPQLTLGNSAIEIIENEISNIAVSVNESVLHVTGANGQMLYIYNVAGVRVMSFKVEGPDKRYEKKKKKGCYIVKVGKVVRKISIR